MADKVEELSDQNQDVFPAFLLVKFLPETFTVSFATWQIYQKIYS